MVWSLLFFALGLLGYCHSYKTLSNDSLKRISSFSVPERLAIEGDFLAPFLVPRVAGTAENARVRDFIVDHFKRLEWHVELDTFTDETPFGPKTFSNVIVTKDPDAPTHLTLAAHFDSKYYRDFEFIGATDSSAPCAILLDIADTLNPLLTRKDRTLQIIFFDGEEAFQEWTATDSIYGARHLAAQWENAFLEQSAHTSKRTKLDKIEVLVLLDLLGTPNPSINNYYRSSSWLFYKLLRLEERLIQMSLMKTKTEKTEERLDPMFNANSIMTFQGYLLGDDHVPFLQRGVNILHIIPYPFPSVWHNPLDTAECLDHAVVLNFAVLFRNFVAEYLELDPVPHSEL
ncbi:hypothetical protein DFQ28_000781 [Apophysomyces sp. BC1034]|nr:hypothetical protein DFQ30_000155 [Apophysomyces sp. BC1015]KAG0181369.1 hypothetical protein DFQ29_008507 [Apophysomyces sp. BC1021]KAG0191178.1 hypothetical protein DFQ28_000781 [Apophysomyces sp. BC1034]